jgi:predicted Zn-dependent peptidase
MINFEKFTLTNGLKVVVHEDKSTPLVALNILYQVGARDEDATMTGFAHLFEHLMFGGSINIPNYDEPLQMAGGENNAFTNNDITNYYLTIPAQNLETAFWLESDRMLSLAFTEKSLEVQRSVVIEEFKQRYLNQPYGDVWLKLRPLAYKVHPYQWATIGKDISHIEDAKIEDVKSFFKKWYIPNNAILTVSGNCSLERAKELCEKWFQDIPAGKTIVRNLPKEPKQTERRELTLVEEVPGNQIYMAFHCCARADEAFFATDLLSDVLSRGKSSPMYQKLVKEQNLFNDIGAYMMSDLDKSLFIIQGDLVDGVDEKNAEEAIWKVIAEVRDFISDKDLKRVKNKVASTLEFAEMNIANKALHLAYYEMLGDANDSNRQAEFYNRVTKEEIQKVCEEILVKENVSVLNYLSKN